MCYQEDQEERIFSPYLVKWKYHPTEESTWMDEATLQQADNFVEDLMSMSS